MRAAKVVAAYHSTTDESARLTLDAPHGRGDRLVLASSPAARRVPRSRPRAAPLGCPAPTTGLRAVEDAAAPACWRCGPRRRSTEMLRRTGTDPLRGSRLFRFARARRAHVRRPAPEHARRFPSRRLPGRDRRAHRSRQPPLVRRRARARMAARRRIGDSLALVLLDLDDFKQVNDEFGHPAGDAVLRASASILDPVSAKSTSRPLRRRRVRRC